jgi:hypothetical protein
VWEEPDNPSMGKCKWLVDFERLFFHEVVMAVVEKMQHFLVGPVIFGIPLRF